MEHNSFFLYPTYEHQRPELLKDTYQRELAAVLAQKNDPDVVTIGHWAQVTNVFETLEAEKVEALSPYYIWTSSYAQERLQWRPKKPIYVIMLRVSRLAEQHCLPVLPQYLGCKSWVTLDQEMSLEGATPVLGQKEYDGILEQAVKVLGAGVRQAAPA